MGPPKSEPFGLTPTLLQKTPFVAHFVAKSGVIGRFGVVHRCIPYPLTTGLIIKNENCPNLITVMRRTFFSLVMVDVECESDLFCAWKQGLKWGKTQGMKGVPEAN